MPADRPARVGYVLKVYPRFSETFVVTEILAREAAGEDLAIFALRPTTDARFHPEIARVQAPVTHLAKPVKLSESWTVLGAARAVLPDFDTRFAGLLPYLVELDAPEVVQGVELAIQAHRAGITHLHAHFASMAARVARVAAGLAGITYSVTTHAKDLFHESVDPALLREVLAHADHVVAISEYNLDFIRTRFPEVAGHAVLIRNGLELARFPYADPAPLAGPLKVLAVGRLVEKKGFDQLVRAAAALAADGVALDVRIAGDGELREDLVRQIAGAGLEGTVQLLGPRSQTEVRELLGWADVMAAPCVVGADGNADGLPTVLLEAMASGLPVIGTDVTGIPEAVRNGTATEPATGVLLPAGDEAALVAALRQVAHPDFPRVGVARAARALIEQRFDAARQSRLLGSRQQPVPALAG
ncbi:glycosyltransferase involved in cell wall biosynthesis [Ornithinicoccus hortensis]|uniref:Glycosyltransferase involved in cell wall biosynthesis n=1 Tax=Ornithinicoccus hortensis TaxID=82346 RepID=A0A542YMC0_9MICO|nr:glycosyltransferase involved in cell wall biosynthesis [Ornithinicoccus hortensis]